MTDLPILRREDLINALGNPRLVYALEQQREVIAETQDAVTTGAESTQAIADATVLTLSPNASFNNERVLRFSSGVTFTDDGTYLTIKADDKVAHVAGGFRVDITAQQAGSWVLPAPGALVSGAGQETLSNKTLAAPILTGINEYADSAAAAAAGVPIGGGYFVIGSDVLHIRRT